MAKFNQYDQKILGLNEQKALAQKLRESAMEAPQGQMVSGWYVAPNITQHLARGLNFAAGLSGEQKARQGLEDIGTQRKAEREQWMAQMPRAQEIQSPAIEGQPPAPPTIKKPSTEDYLTWATRGVEIDPSVAGMGMQFANLEENRADRSRARAEQAATRERELQMRMENQRELQQMQLDARRQNQQMIAALRPQKEAKPVDWKYDAGSDTWVMPPTSEYPMGRSTPNAGKVGALKNVDYLGQQFLGVENKPGLIDRATTGGWLGVGGAIGSVTNSQNAKAFDNASEQLSTEMRKIFRIPGEGSLSDKEQAQYGLQLPKRGNSAELNRQILQDLQVRARNAVLPPTNPLSGGATGGWASDNTGGAKVPTSADIAAELARRQSAR
jgi:hypothetical protein